MLFRSAVEAVCRLLAEAERLAVPQAGQQHLGRHPAEGGVAARLRLQQGEHQQQAHAGGEGCLLGLLEQALALEEGQGLLVCPPGPLAFLLLLQGQLPLRPPQASQRVEPVLQEASVCIALVAADGAETLGELGRVLGLEREDLEDGTHTHPGEGGSRGRQTRRTLEVCRLTTSPAERLHVPCMCNRQLSFSVIWTTPNSI